MEERIWHKSYDPQVPPSIDYEKITLPEALDRSARNYPAPGGPGDDGQEDLLPGTEYPGKPFCQCP